jgi:hypothetical protein
MSWITSIFLTVLGRIFLTTWLNVEPQAMPSSRPDVLHALLGVVAARHHDGIYAKPLPQPPRQIQAVGRHVVNTDLDDAFAQGGAQHARHRGPRYVYLLRDFLLRQPLNIVHLGYCDQKIALVGRARIHEKTS